MEVMKHDLPFCTAGLSLQPATVMCLLSRPDMGVDMYKWLLGFFRGQVDEPLVAAQSGLTSDARSCRATMKPSVRPLCQKLLLSKL